MAKSLSAFLAQNAKKVDNRKIALSPRFVDENGKAMQRMFDRIERSKRSDVLYRKIESAIRDMGNSVSPQEKRQVLMEILEKLC